jgi:threonine-phosphate decarboxylase
MSHSYDHGGNIFSVARQLGFSPADSIDFSASINPLGVSAKVRDAIIGALGSLIHYPDNGCSELKRVLADIHGLSPANFAVANGSTEIIYTLPALLPGKRALIISPAFSEYGYALEQNRWEVDRFLLSPRDNFTLHMEELAVRLAERYDALYLCNPGNPSAMLYPRRTIEQVYELCRQSGTFLVLDEAFMDFCEESSAKETIIATNQGIVLRSMTKFYGIPGLRLGYAMAAPPLIDKLSAMGGPWSVNTLAQVAGVAALHDAEYSRQSRAYIDHERSRLGRLLAEFPQLTVYPSSVNFLLLEINGSITSTELQQRLMNKRILIRDCANFSGLSNRFFRVAVRTTEENTRLLECLREILL